MNNSSHGINSDTYYCPSLWPLDMPWIHLTIWAVLSMILAPITVICNAAFIYGIYKTQQLNSITNKFILVMNLSDLCTGLIVLPMVTALIALKDKFRNCKFELITQFLAFLLAYFSFFMLMSVSLDRYLHVTKLNKYNRFMNECRMKVIVIVSFATSIAVACISIVFPSFVLQVILNSSDLSGVLFMFVLYSMVFRKIAHHAEKFKKMLTEVGGAESVNRETRREMSATKTIRFVLGALLVLYLPYNICSAIWTYFKYSERRNPPQVMNVLEYFAYIIVFSNAAINAIIFGYGNSAIRRFLAGKLSRRLSGEISPASALTSSKAFELSEKK